MCRVVLVFNLLPRYGRLYKMIPGEDGPTLGPATWTWQRHGHWGVNLLDRMNLMWAYIAEYERRHPDASSGPVVD